MTSTAPRPDLFPGQHFISTVLDSLETKTEMSGALTRVYLQRAAMAGFLIGLFYALNYAIIAAFDSIGIADGTLLMVGRVLGALAFGWALVFIYFSRSELLTSTMMIVTVGVYHQRIRAMRAARLLALCYLGNVLGGLAVALLFLGSSITAGPVGEQMSAAVEHKLAFITDGPGGWLDLLIRAILCNFFINIAMLLVYNGLIRSDVLKAFVMIISVFVFAFTGLEHSVANTVLFTVVGLREGIDIAAAAGNLGIALLGNFLGGGLLIGWYYAYANDDRRYLKSQDSPAETA